MIVAVFAVLGVIALALILAAFFPHFVSWLTVDDEADHDPYGFWSNDDETC